MNEEIHPGPGAAPDEIARFKEAAARYWKPAALAAAALLLAVLAIALVGRNARMKAREAEEMLTAARTTKDLETLIERHSSSRVVPVALLKNAKLYFDSGNYAAALDEYGKFLKKFPQHAMARVAVLGEILCAEARGDIQGALPRYSEFAAKNPDHYLAPEAVMGRARCLEQMGRVEEARGVYEDFLTANEDSVWAPLCRERLLDLGRRTAREERSKRLQAAGTGNVTNAPASEAGTAVSNP